MNVPTTSCIHSIYILICPIIQTNKSLLKKAGELIIEKFELGHYPWAHCFRSIYLGTASLSKSQDRYEPMMQNRDLLWVNGPNRQFEAAAAAVQNPSSFFRPPSASSSLGASTSGTAGGAEKLLEAYDSFYLMEPDSVPWRQGWLSSLVDEMQQRRPFAVLGSK